MKGIGYTLCRTHINSCDFSSESYAYTEVPGDTTLAHFCLAHDRRYRIPFIKEAIGVAGSALGIFASPSSPPAWMKTNNHMLRGGKVKPEYRNIYYYLGHFARFIRPGSVRIACACNEDDLLATAFATPQGDIAVVALNLTDDDLRYRVWIDGQAASTVAPAHSIATLLLEP